MDLPHLRYVTQAGGRLAPDAVRRWAELGRASAAGDLFVMYGQTEATARMAYLPPELAPSRPRRSACRSPAARFDASTARRDDGVGELVYRGPNVMLGYADGPADLAARPHGRRAAHRRPRPRARPTGCTRSSGGAAGSSSCSGCGSTSAQVERLLADEGCAAVCAGVDDELLVAVRTGPDPDAVRAMVSDRLGLPAGHVRVVVVEDFPRRPNGKIDHAALLAKRPPAAAAPGPSAFRAGGVPCGLPAPGHPRRGDLRGAGR